MRPNLTRDISIQDFKNFYWLKEELQSFCREHGISASGSKIEITDRIETFLQTGEIKKALRKPKSKTQSQTQANLSLDTVITENHRCSQDVRAFFKTIISPKFHFSTYIQNYFKNNVGKTYRDVVAAWYEEEERKKDPVYKKDIAPQFEYNQFTRDFFADPNNKGKSRKEAIEAWNNIKGIPGSNKYISNHS
ncbi:cytoplasmic protein [Bacillus pseudomycoides]|nr:cytoplasmic protein [Bacillus pseudomycoides]